MKSTTNSFLAFESPIPAMFFLLAFFILLSFTHDTKAQGCSDAGFCTAGSLKASAENDTVPRSLVGLKAIYGVGEKNTTIFQLMPEIELSLTERSTLQASIPYVMASGKLGSNSGIGDVILSYSYRLPVNDKASLSFTAGARLPTGTTDEEYKGNFSFPMPYQTGLGTTDLILGASLNYSKWNLAVGYQGVLNHNNNNNYYHYPFVNLNSDELAYFESNHLKRGNDLLVRAGRLFEFGKVNVAPGLLAIYRVNKDKITDISGKEVELEGSDGLTLNINLAAIIPAGDKFSFRVEAGAPVQVRDYRADGLTRSLVAAVAGRFHF